ncbi:MAG: ATP phosphoribosyltransferase regulatory subunit [Egibacteraceae bacterium]
MAIPDRRLDLPRGVRDSDPHRTILYRKLAQDWFDACALAGFQPVSVPPVGFADTFTAGHHAAGAKLYRFPDRRGRDLALVSDSLPALLRLARTRSVHEQRLSYCCPIFRYERRPRRYFHHLGLMEVYDHPTTLEQQVRSTTRLGQVVAGFLASRLPVVFTVINPGLWHALVGTFLPHEGTTKIVHSLRRSHPDQRAARLRRLRAPAEAVRLAELLVTDPALGEALDTGAGSIAVSRSLQEHVSAAHQLAAALQHHGAQAGVDLGELHASEFHDGPSFLLRPHAGGRLVGDGGSYGLFARAFLGTPASVFSAIIGLERLADLTGSPEAAPAADIAVLAHPEVAEVEHADRLTALMRAAGLAVWDVVLTNPLRHHLRDLAALAIPYSVIIGPRELVTSQYTVRDHTGVLQTVGHDDLVGWLINRRVR